MTQFDCKIVEETGKELYIRALKILPPDVREALKKAADKETQSRAKEIFQTILRNVEVSDQKDMLICQDTGLPIYMVKVGSKFPFDGAKVSAALKEGAKRATLEHPFRGSSTHPVTRVNPQTSVGEGLPIIYWDFLADSDCLDILMVPKGSGSENMSAMKMFIPADGVAAVKKFVIDTVLQSGSNPCPPGVIGVGIGGTFEKCAEMAKRALLRGVGERNPNPFYAKLEEELLERVNKLGIGPQGFGGRVTALDVHVETYPCHIASFPAAVNIQCHAARHKEAVI